MFSAAVTTFETVRGSRMEVDFAPFRDAGRMICKGPAVAERLNTTQHLLTEIRKRSWIIERGRSFSALDAFRAQYQLSALLRNAEKVMATINCLLLPTVGSTYKITAVMADPVRLNTNLGLYTNFANLLDLSAVVLHAGFRKAIEPNGPE